MLEVIKIINQNVRWTVCAQLKLVTVDYNKITGYWIADNVCKCLLIVLIILVCY